MKKKEITIFYYSSYYDCCGPNFSIGEYIWWSLDVAKETILVGDKKIKIDYFCENCAGGNILISGKIKKIEVIKDDKLIICNKSRELDGWGEDYIVYLEEIELYNKKFDNLSYLSNPYFKIDQYKKEEYIYKKVYIIGDLNDIEIDITKMFKKNHFETEIITSSKTRSKKVYNVLKEIRSYSKTNIYNYKINLKYYNNHLSKNLNKSLIILIDNDNKYKKIYEKMVNKLYENYSEFNICYINKYNKGYKVKFNYKDNAKNKYQVKKYIDKTKLTKKELEIVLKNNKNIKVIYTVEKSFYNKKELLKFLSDKERKDIKLNYTNNIIFYGSIVLYLIIKFIQIFMR